MPLIPFSTTLLRFVRAIWAAFKDPESRDLVLFAALTLLTGMTFYHTVEGWNWLDSLYFCVVTLTTIGYGDLAPATPLGKMFTIVYIVVGLGTLLGFINLVASNARRPLIPRRGKKNQAEPTPPADEKPETIP
jgi:hypothetical protein